MKSHVVSALRRLLPLVLPVVFGFSLFGSPLYGQGHSLVGPGGEVDWNRYYSSGEAEQILREFHGLYPELTEMYEIGKSFEGRPLWVMEVTAEITGPAAEKPAAAPTAPTPPPPTTSVR